MLCLKWTTALRIENTPHGQPTHILICLRGDFLQNRVLGAQNQSDARMRN